MLGLDGRTFFAVIAGVILALYVWPWLRVKLGF